MKTYGFFITVGIALLAASTAAAQSFSVLGNVAADSDPAVFQQKQFDVSGFFPEENSATVTFDFKNDTPPLPGPGDDPNLSRFKSELTVSQISAARLTDEFQFRFQYLSGADSNHLRDVQLSLDGAIFRDQFAAFNDHLGNVRLGTATMGAGSAFNSLGQSGPVAQIYLIPFTLTGSSLNEVFPEFVFNGDDLVTLSVPGLTPCDDGGCGLSGPDFNSVFAAVSGASGGLIEIADSLFSPAFGCVGSSCMETEIVQFELLDVEKFSLDFADPDAVNAAYDVLSEAISGKIDEFESLTDLAREEADPYSVLSAFDGVAGLLEVLASKDHESGQNSAGDLSEVIAALDEMAAEFEELKAREMEGEVGIYSAGTVSDVIAALDEIEAKFEQFKATATEPAEKETLSPEDNETLSAEEFIVKFPDRIAAELTLNEFTQAIALLMGESETVETTLYREAQAAGNVYKTKLEGFVATKKGAALFAARNEEGGLTEEYLAAAQAYAPDEYQDWMAARKDANIYSDKLREIESDEDSDRIFKYLDDDSDTIATGGQPDPGQNPIDPAAAVQQALGAQHQLDMNDEIDSVMPELTAITVIAQAGPVKTYAAANGPATIVTAFADTRK